MAWLGLSSPLVYTIKTRLLQPPERILFPLPDLNCWVEVKGKAEPRDDYLLREVAGYLARERQERLFIYFQAKASVVSEDSFKELKHAEFWRQLSEAGKSTVWNFPICAELEKRLVRACGFESQGYRIKNSTNQHEP